MSKEGSLARIAKYEATGNIKMLEQEKKFFNENYGEATEPEKPKKDKKG